jgi:hypothetical protein
VEDRWRPKSDSGSDRLGGPEQGGEAEGLEAIAQYGRGRFDEATGTYEWYEVPEEVTAPGKGVTWQRILEKWKALEADFRSEYQVRLSSPKVRCRMSWREFVVLVHGLLSADTRLRRELQPEGDADGVGGADDGGLDQREADA